MHEGKSGEIFGDWVQFYEKVIIGKKGMEICYWMVYRVIEQDSLYCYCSNKYKCKDYFKRENAKK